VPVVADYRVSPFGGGWVASIALDGMATCSVRGADVHETLHRVMDEIGRLASERDAVLVTMHQLGGDPGAFAELAERQGFGACVDSFSTARS